MEQYIVRELKEDIKLLIKKVTELEKKIDDSKSDPGRVDETFKRYAGYREWNKTHDSYKILHSPYGNKT